MFAYLARPVILTIIGFMIYDLVGSFQPEVKLLAPLAEKVRSMQGYFLWIPVAGLIWFGYRAWRLWRCMWHGVDYGCPQCLGPMRELSGRYGAYRKCEICGATEKGW